MDFARAFELLLGHEGALSMDPNDPGNWTGGKVGSGQLRGTKYGISAAAYPAEDIAGMTLERAKMLYRRDYWDKTSCDALPDAIRFDLFDTAVNSGAGTAIRLLQRAVGEFEDGVIGARTLQAVNAMHPDRLRLRFSAHRRIKWATLSTWHQFGRGWSLRQARNDLL